MAWRKNEFSKRAQKNGWTLLSCCKGLLSSNLSSLLGCSPRRWQARRQWHHLGRIYLWRLLADSFCPLAPEIRQCVPGASFFQSIKRRIFGGIAPVNVFQISFFRRNYAVNPTQRKKFYSDFMLFQYVKLDKENQARRWGASIFLRRLSQWGALSMILALPPTLIGRQTNGLYVRSSSVFLFGSGTRRNRG